MTTRILLGTGLGMLALSVAVAAQGKKEQPPLGAVAKAAQEEKAKKPAETTKATAEPKSEKTEKTAAKKYSNEDLDGRPRPSSPTAHRTAIKGASMVSSDNVGQDEQYWRERAEPLRRRLQYSTERLNSAKAQLERARTDGGLYVPTNNGRPSEAQLERQRLARRVSELEADVRRDQQAITDLEEDARRAGALPGWLR